MGIEPDMLLEPGLMVGPIGGVFNNLVKGVGNVSRGEWGEAAKSMSPRAWRGATTRALGGGDIRDKSGRLLYVPSAGETAGYLLGFQPQGLSQLREEQETTRRSEDIAGAKLDR